MANQTQTKSKRSQRRENIKHKLNQKDPKDIPSQTQTKSTRFKRRTKANAS